MNDLGIEFGCLRLKEVMRVFFIALALVLFSLRASAQQNIDADFIVDNAGIGWTATATGYGGSSTHSGVLPMLNITHGRLTSSRDSIYGPIFYGFYVSFIVDTARHAFRHVTITYKTYPQPPFSGQEMDQYTLSYPDLSYVDSASNYVFGPERAAGSFDGNVGIWVQDGSRSGQTGGWSQQMTLNAPVFIRLHKSSLSVQQAAQLTPFSIERSAGRIVLMFSSTSDADMEISNTIGQIVLREKIRAEQSSLELKALPPGCYFARLSASGASEVVKFVVAL